MAAIVPVTTPHGSLLTVRSGATTSQTDWINVPAWAKYADVYLTVTTAGTSTALTISSADPVLRNDSNAIALFAGATITATGEHVYLIGPYPKVAEVADAAAADAVVLQDELASLPPLLGLGVAVTGSTYTLSVHFKG